MQQTITITPDSTIPQTLKKIALHFSAKHIFVPCFAKAEGNKKPPVKMGYPKNTPLKDKLQSPTDLDSFDTMDILSIYLGDELIAIDIDGIDAMKVFQTISRNLGKLPETLYVTSDPLGKSRGAYFFRIPKKYKGKIQHHSQSIGSTGDKLEFRTGEHYQAISGKHPVSGFYYSDNIGNFNYGNLTELPDNWAEYICNAKLVSGVKQKEDNEQILVNKFVTLSGLLELLDELNCDKVNVDDYDTWIKVGMIYHSIDPESGFEPWVEWSNKSENPATDQVFIQKWDSFSDTRNSVTIGTVFYWLDQKIRESDILVTRKEEIHKQILTARKFLTDRICAEDKVDFLRALKAQGLDTFSLKMAIDNFVLDTSGNLNPYVVQSLWDDYNSLDQGISVDEKAAYTKSLFDAALSPVDTSDVKEILSDCPIIQLIHAHFEDQGLGKHVPIALMSFITCVASVMPKGVTMNFNQQYNRPPIIFSLIIGKPSDGKNALCDGFKRPLENATKTAHNSYGEEIRLANQREKQFNSLDKKGKENAIAVWALENNRNIDGDILEARMEMFAEPVKPPIYAMQGFSVEAIRAKAGENRKQGFLVCPDEIMQTFSNQAKYQGKNKGLPDMSEYNSMYDGGSTLTHLISDTTYRYADNYQASILSTIQPGIFDSNFCVGDSDGFLSRCLYLSVEEPIDHKLNEDPDNPDVTDISPILWAIYQDIMIKFDAYSRENPLTMRFTYEAKQVYNQFVRWCNEKAEEVSAISDGMRQFLRRTPAKFASVLIAANAVKYQQGIIDDPAIVDLKTTLEIIKFARIFIDYAQKIYKVSFGVDNLLINPDKMFAYEKVINLLKRSSKPVTIRTLQSQKWRDKPELVTAFNRTNKFIRSMGVAEFRILAEEMETMGWIEYDKVSQTIKLVEGVLESPARTEIDIKLFGAIKK